ncbi:response regulator transcription factor [Mariniluteicoccus flavus]
MVIRIRVLLVEDHPVVRLGIRSALESAHDVTVVAECATYECGLKHALTSAPDVVVLPLRLEGALLGIDLCREVSGLSPRPRVLIYTATDDPDDASNLYLAGADSFLHKGASVGMLVEAVRRTAAGERVWRTSRPQPTVEEVDRKHLLTPREREILGLMLERLTNQEIAAALVLGLPTVKTHVGNVLAKLGLRRRQDLF